MTANESRGLKQKPIMFMGTPDFAVPSLEALIANGYNVTAVVTQPDKPSGRGYKLTPSAVKICAEAHGIPVFQPESLKKAVFNDTLCNIAPAAVVVAAFGKILYPYILRFPQFGCINVHGSLLPKYRGAAPMQRAIIDGETETGVTIMRMNNGIDTGDMYCKSAVEIGEDDNFEVIHDRLAKTGAEALIHTLGLIDSGEAVAEKQDEALATYAAKIENADCAIDFTRSASELHNSIRGLSPFPLAVATLRGKKVKLVASAVINRDSNFFCENIPAGTVLSTDGGIIAVACGQGALAITALLPEGKRRMSAADFINGRGVTVGDVFERVAL